MKIIIIGGVAGGASAAARARRLSETSEIILLERGPDVSFANCGLPYHIGNLIPQRDKLLVTTPQRLRERFNLDVRTLNEVLSINRAKKSITVLNHATGLEYEETYDALILAPGATPLRPTFLGHDLPNVYTLRTLADTDRIKTLVDNKIQHAVVVGAGFIGIELAENLLHRGVTVTLVNTGKQILPPFDAEMTTPMATALTTKGVTLKLGTTVESIRMANNDMAVSLTNSEVVTAQLVVLGIGVTPENKLATVAGLDIGPRGGIRVNEYLQTSDASIYAAGDAIETSDFNTNTPTQIPLAGPANRQGRICANNIFGRKSKYRGTQGTAILGFFNHTLAMTGQSEKALKRNQTPYRKVYVHPAHHAGYYPGAEGMTLKLLFAPTTGKILGAQGAGGAGVDKRIDVLAVAIQAGMTVMDLEEMELCYAPQFGSAKDPVNMVGFVAAGLVRGDHPQTDWETYSQAKADYFLVDVRTPEEYAKGQIPGAVNIPVDELRQRLPELQGKGRVLAYCQVGQRGYLATRILMQNGYQVSNLSGGYKTYLLHCE